MDKPIVSTDSRGDSSKKKKIAEYLVLHPEGCTPKMIALGTTINVNTVKSILPKLLNIESPARGWYKVVNRGDRGSIAYGDLEAWNFHNLIMQVQLKTFVIHHHVIDLDLVKIDISISEQGSCSIRLSTDYPINVSSMCLLFGYIKCYLREYTADDLTMPDVIVRTIEFNKDHANLKLDGVNCITLDSLATQFKLYQKKIGLRVEHKTKVPFNVENMVDMLTGSSTAIDLSNRMTDQIAKLDRLTGQTIYNTQLLNKLLEARK